MIIGIDGNEANVGKRVGIGEYAFELLRQFEKFEIRPASPKLQRGENSKFEIYLKNQPNEDFPKEREGWKYRIIGPKKLWTQFALPLDLFFHKPQPDVFFTPTHYAPRFSPVPTVVSVMDLSFIFYPDLFKKSDLFQLKKWTAYSVKKAKKVLTISRASKDDIIKIYQVPEEKVIVTYPGTKVKGQKSKGKNSMQNSKLIEKYGISKEYILFVGTLQPRKNLVRLIQAYSLLVSRYPDVSLVIVGKKGWLYDDILATPQKHGVVEKVLFLDFVSDSDLDSLYQHAICFVLPSLYEGFGLPVLEAMKNGCPVVISNVSSLPEAGGEAALYVDPLRVSDIAEKIEQLLNSKKLRERLISKGYDQVKKFRWEETARKTLGVLEEVASKKSA